MTDMFYNYDNNIDVKEYEQDPFFQAKEPKQGCTEVRLLKNIKGEELGVKVKQNSKTKLYFSLDNLNDLATTELYRSTFTFEVLNFKLKPLVTLPVDISTGAACIDLIASEAGPIKYGNYRMHLYITVPVEGDEDLKYTLFAPLDGILSVE